MYLGLVVAALGSLFLYHTWTTLAYAIFAPFVLLRARREELALAAEFEQEWNDYCRRVPAFVPRPWKMKPTSVWKV
jgi:protein-S-isoprenylcysteine O-methyltransferase Ste14